VEKRLADARSRVPKHDVPAAVILEIDELDEELERLRALAKNSLEVQIAEVASRLEDARARIPKHTPPPNLMVEIDELEEELERLRLLRDDS
jgi:hypothetical protein